MNVADIVRRVQKEFGDPHENAITVEDIVDWINAAQRDIARQIETLQEYKGYNFDPIMNQNGYWDLPTDFIREVRVTYDKKPLDKTRLEDLDSIGVSPGDPTGQPYLYYIWGTKLCVWPNPTVADTNVLELWYNKMPSTVGNSGFSLLDIPENYHEDVVRYCVMKAKEWDQDYQGANMIAAQMDARLSHSRYEAQNQGNSYPSVRLDPGDVWS